MEKYFEAQHLKGGSQCGDCSHLKLGFPLFFICDCLFITGSFVDKLAMIVYHQENSGNAVKRKSRKRDPFREQADGASLQSLLLKVASERTAERDVG